MGSEAAVGQQPPQPPQQESETQQQESETQQQTQQQMQQQTELSELELWSLLFGFFEYFAAQFRSSTQDKVFTIHEKRGALGPLTKDTVCYSVNRATDEGYGRLLY
jgi:hypothetical protein